MHAKNIILVGFMGTGKSAVAAVLADKLGWSMVDTDERIVSEAGMSIPDIFERFGEPRFRELESEVLRRVTMQNRQVIATGGGAVLAEQNRRQMLENGLVVALVADPETIIQRVGADANRPLLKGDARKRVYEMMEQRKDAYRFAPVTIDTTGKSIGQVADLILREWQSLQH